MKCHYPLALGGGRNAAPNTLGIRRVAISVDDIDAAADGLLARGTELFGGVGKFQDTGRFCYVRGQEGTIVMHAERIG
ncbi:hypothetical protein [Arthrobacter sp. NicSoilB8]|uniref:hypothetical protein n=1 Tax=Arthrobacter sp. NicSoilB8 TaxID=2830998 RepID=UPI001CC6CC9F|nr:hypothetical protein [Arthrobacter sp. NicSoilB8]BCW70999.1 hypothetical protein NicSoilB8_20430 [Arthrobacter sp. NicSoilB8]